MICVENVNMYCNDIENIEGYDKALSSEELYDCHHRLETHTSGGEKRLVDLSKEELIALGVYYNRPAEELIFMTHAEHTKIHFKGKPMSEEHKRKISETKKQKISSGEINPPPSRKGVHLSEEQKRYLSEINKGKHHSEETKRKMSGWYWYNNGKISVRAKECPEGFAKGRLSTNKGKHWKPVDGKRVYY